MEKIHGYIVIARVPDSGNFMRFPVAASSEDEALQEVGIQTGLEPVGVMSEASLREDLEAISKLMVRI